MKGPIAVTEDDPYSMKHRMHSQRKRILELYTRLGKITQVVQEHAETGRHEQASRALADVLEEHECCMTPLRESQTVKKREPHKNVSK